MSIQDFIRYLLYGGLSVSASVMAASFVVLAVSRDPPRKPGVRYDWYDFVVESMMRSILWLEGFLMLSWLFFIL